MQEESSPEKEADADAKMDSAAEEEEEDEKESLLYQWPLVLMMSSIDHSLVNFFSGALAQNGGGGTEVAFPSHSMALK